MKATRSHTKFGEPPVYLIVGYPARQIRVPTSLLAVCCQPYRYCDLAQLPPRATRSRNADIPRRLRIPSRHRRKASVPDGIVNTCPAVGGLGPRPSPRVHDGVESVFTLGGNRQSTGRSRGANCLLSPNRIVETVATALSAVALRVSRRERAATDVPHGRASISIRCRRQSHTPCGSSRV